MYLLLSSAALSLLAVVAVWLAGRQDPGRSPLLTFGSLLTLLALPFLALLPKFTVELPAIASDAEPGAVSTISWFAIAWAAGFALFTIRLALDFASLTRWRRRAIDHDDPVVDEVLELTDLTHKISDQVDSLSRGMKQRLALARVLLHDPDLLLLDEPASGLDPRARIEVRELLKALTEMGKTILISSHILHELAHLCTRIGIIETGTMVAQGTLEDIYRKLSLMRVVHVQLTGADEDVISKIENIEGVSNVEAQVDRIAIHLLEDHMAVEDLHEALVGLGLRIHMFQPEAMDMETAFMKLTEGKTA